jgi:hypothetical protein
MESDLADGFENDARCVWPAILAAIRALGSA